MSGRGPPPGMMTSPGGDDCCICFPLEGGVRTLFLLVVVAFIGVIVNIIIGAVEEWWYVFIQVLFLIPMLYTLCYIGAWSQNDNYNNRKQIANGFAATWVLSLIANLTILFIVIFALEEFYDSDGGWDHEKHMIDGGMYGHGNTYTSGPAHGVYGYKANL